MRENDQSLKAEWDQWKKELLNDEDWCASLVRYSGKGLAIIEHALEAMTYFDDFIVLKAQEDTTRTKKEYQMSFIGWWRHNNWETNRQLLTGTKQVAPPRTEYKKPAARKSRYEEMMEVAAEAKLLTKKMYENNGFGYDSEFVTGRMIDLLLETYVLLGFKTPVKEDVSVLAAKLVSDIYENCGFLRLEEISICFELGAQEQFGDYIGLNYRTFHKWLKGYKNSDLRYRVIKQIEQEKELKALPAVSREYNEEKMNLLIIRRFHEYKNCPDLEIPLASILYKDLQSRGFIRNSLEEKLNAMAQFSRWRPQNTLHISEDDRQAMIKLKAQEWLLKQYFNSLVRLPFES